MMRFDTLRKEYIDSLYALECLSFPVPWTKQAFENELENENACYVLLLDEDTVIGYCAFWQAADMADITNVAVHPDYRRQGLGKKILNRILQEAHTRSITQLFLEVRVSNTPAQALYTACGFQLVGMRKKYYADNGEDAVIMMREQPCKIL